MKKFIVLGTTVMVLGYGGFVSAQNTDPGPPPIPAGQAGTLPSSVIDGIKVPYEVDLYVQWEYQGFAITKASKITRGGQGGYRLLISRFDEGSGDKSFYLYYDKEWELLSREDVPVAPPPKARTEQKDDKEPKPQEEEQEDDKPEGGRGAGEEEPEPGEEPEPPVEEPEEDEDQEEEPDEEVPGNGRPQN